MDIDCSAEDLRWAEQTLAETVKGEAERDALLAKYGLPRDRPSSSSTDVLLAGLDVARKAAGSDAQSVITQVMAELIWDEFDRENSL